MNILKRSKLFPFALFLIFTLGINVCQSGKVEFVNNTQFEENGTRKRDAKSSNGGKEMRKSSGYSKIPTSEGYEVYTPPNNYASSNADPNAIDYGSSGGGGYEKPALMTHPYHTNRYHQLVEYYNLPQKHYFVAPPSADYNYVPYGSNTKTSTGGDYYWDADLYADGGSTRNGYQSSKAYEPPKITVTDWSSGKGNHLSYGGVGGGNFGSSGGGGYGGGGGGGFLKTSGKPVNNSAVSLLGLLALMGMIQQVMADLDATFTTSFTQTSGGNGNGDFGTGNMLRPTSRPRPPRPIQIRPTSKPAPVTMRPVTMRPTMKPATTTRKPNRTKRASVDHLNAPNIFRRISETLLPLYMDISEAFYRKDYITTILASEKIYRTLVKDFRIPEKLARICLQESLRVIRDNFKNQNYA